MGNRTTVIEQIRQAILASGETRKAVAEATGIWPSQLCRFISGERGLSSEGVDKLCGYLGLELRPIQRKKGD